MLRNVNGVRPVGRGGWFVVVGMWLALGSCDAPQPAGKTPATVPVAAKPSAAAPTVSTSPSVPKPEPKDKVRKHWKVVTEADFESHGKVYAKDGTIVLEAGSPMTGIVWTGPLPTEDYEVTLEAMRVEGSDFFCGMTFPVGDSPCTFIIGGWGGCVVGLSNVDDMNASENETTSAPTFENGQWYRIRLRVTKETIKAWVGGEKMFELARRDRRFSVWDEQLPCRPLGIATWFTKAALRDFAIRKLKDTP